MLDLRHLFDLCAFKTYNKYVRINYKNIICGFLQQKSPMQLPTATAITRKYSIVSDVFGFIRGCIRSVDLNNAGNISIYFHRL